jgi:hypothetical protein
VNWSNIRYQSIPTMKRLGGRLKTYGPNGRIHRLHWSYDKSIWYVGCKGTDSPTPAGIVLTRATPITCEKKGCV